MLLPRDPTPSHHFAVPGQKRLAKPPSEPSVVERPQIPNVGGELPGLEVKQSTLTFAGCHRSAKPFGIRHASGSSDEHPRLVRPRSHVHSLHGLLRSTPPVHR